jgi:hypothetical protein
MLVKYILFGLFGLGFSGMILALSDQQAIQLPLPNQTPLEAQRLDETDTRENRCAFFQTVLDNADDTPLPKELLSAYQSEKAYMCRD